MITPLVLALSKRNSNAAEIIIFLHRLASVLTEYFKELEEESIRDNFVIVYELLDEMMDFGFPQTTESKILQESVQAIAIAPPLPTLSVHLALPDYFSYRSVFCPRYITQESHKLEVQVRPPMAVTNAVSWRSEGIRYRKNEVFLDVIESVNLLVSTCPKPSSRSDNVASDAPHVSLMRLLTGQRQRRRH